MKVQDFIAELTYANYAHNRRISPEISPERWARIYPNASALEARYQTELLMAELTA